MVKGDREMKSFQKKIVQKLIDKAIELSDQASALEAKAEKRIKSENSRDILLPKIPNLLPPIPYEDFLKNSNDDYRKACLNKEDEMAAWNDLKSMSILQNKAINCLQDNNMDFNNPEYRKLWAAAAEAWKQWKINHPKDALEENLVILLTKAQELRDHAAFLETQSAEIIEAVRNLK